MVRGASYANAVGQATASQCMKRTNWMVLWMLKDPYLTVASIKGVARANEMQPDPRLHSKRQWENVSVSWMTDVEEVFKETVASLLQDNENIVARVNRS